MGGTRNWDYRYCWLRDATFTLRAFMHAGYYDEARAWRDWLLRAAAAVGQTQLDVFGEILDALYHAHLHGLPPVERAVAIGRAILGHLAGVWERPDEGIWEVRGPPQHFTHSKVMAWVAFDRAVKILERRDQKIAGEDAIERLRRIREDIHRDVCSNGFDTNLGSFVQAYGSKALDASLLLLPLVGFLPATDPRMIGTVQAIERRCRSPRRGVRPAPLASARQLPAGVLARRVDQYRVQSDPRSGSCGATCKRGTPGAPCRHRATFYLKTRAKAWQCQAALVAGFGHRGALDC
jgi:GH15 family glucan-1,4-alpha-glucosidase